MTETNSTNFVSTQHRVVLPKRLITAIIIFILLFIILAFMFNGKGSIDNTTTISLDEMYKDIRDIDKEIEINKEKWTLLEMEQRELNAINDDLRSAKEELENKILDTLGMHSSASSTENEGEMLGTTISKNEISDVEKGSSTNNREPGKLTEDGTHQEMPTTTGTDSHQRFKQIAQSYGLDAGLIWETENHYKIKEGVILCIAIAETSGGKFGAGINNIGNVANTDSNPRGQSYGNVGASLDAIGRTLNNGYLGSKKTLACLSNAGNCSEEGDNGKRYATSNGNRERNMVACLGSIYGEATPQFNIRR